MHEGHRARMLERLARNDNLEDHELLEVVLYNAIPRKNTNETAHALLSAFGSLRGVMHADVEELAQIQGVGKATAAYLHAVAELLARTGENETNYPRVANAGTFSAFLSQRYLGLDEEVVEIFLLDGHDNITFCKRYTAHSVNLATVPVEEVSRILGARNPTGVVVSHNHPKASSEPSAEDDDFTAKMLMLCSMNNVALGDHLIVGENSTFSYFLSGRLERMRKLYNITNMIGRHLL